MYPLAAGAFSPTAALLAALHNMWCSDRSEVLTTAQCNPFAHPDDLPASLGPPRKVSVSDLAQAAAASGWTQKTYTEFRWTPEQN